LSAALAWISCPASACTLQDADELSQSSSSNSPSSPDQSCTQPDCQVTSSKNSPTKKPPAPRNASENQPDNTMTFKKVFINLPGDQKAIWTSPFRLHSRDLLWGVPLLGTTGVLIGSDRHSMERERSNSSAIGLSNNIANGGLAGMVALPSLAYVWG